MTTEDVVSSTKTNHKRARKLGYGLLAGVAVLTMAGCASGETFVDGWWDNGDPVLVPTKASLFDADGKPLCATATAFGTVETRSRAFGETGGVVNAFLFEITNPETDPSTGATAAERNKLAILQNSDQAMYQLTFPAFDKKHDIKSAEDMAAVKAEFQEHFPDLLTEGKVVDYVKIDDQWIDGPEGHFSVKRASDPEGYIKDNKIDTKFNGIQNQYFVARSDDGTEYLLERNKNTGVARLLRHGEDPVTLDASTESFTRYFVENESTGVNPDGTITLVNDQCLPVGGQQAARYWVYDYKLLNGAEQKPNVIE